MSKVDDPIVKEVHDIRARLIEKYGGSEGYAEHLRELQKELGARVVTREPRRPVTSRRKIS